MQKAAERYTVVFADLTIGEPIAAVKESLGPAAALFRRVREAANFDDVLHPRDSEGKFRTVFDRVNRALTEWAKGEGPDHPIEALHLSRPSLMRVSKKMGVTPRRGAPDSEIEDGILAKAREIDRGRRDGAKAAKAAAPSTAADRVRAVRPKMPADEMVGNLEIMHGDALREHAKRAGVDTSGPDADVRDRIRAKATEVLMGEPRKRPAPAPETPSIMQPSDGPALYNPDGGGWGAIAGAWLGVDKGKSGPAPVSSGPVKLSAAEKERRRKILAAPVSEPTVLRPEHGIGVFSQDLHVSAQATSGLDAAAAPATAAAKVRAAKAIRRDLLREHGIDAHYQPAGVVRAVGEANRRLARGDSPAEVAQYLRQSAQSLNPADDDQTSKTLMDPATLRERHRLGKKTLRDLAASVAKESPAAKAAPRKAPAGAPKATLPVGPNIEVASSTKDLSNEQLMRGENLTPAGRQALDSLGPGGHPRIAAIPDTEGKIREAYRMLSIPGHGNDHFAALADVRKLLGEQVPRSDLDATLKGMYRRGAIRLEPQSYARGNAATRIPAAVMIGGQENNLLHIADPTLARPGQFGALDMADELDARRTGEPGDPMMALLSDAELQAEIKRRAARDPMVAQDLAARQPAKATPAKKAAPRKAAVKALRSTPADAAEGLRLASTREEGHALLQDASVADLKEIARLSGVHLRPGATKAQIRDEIVQTRVGARVSSAAIRGERVVPGPKVEPLPTAAAKAAAKAATRPMS